MGKFLGLLRNFREPVTDAEVREYFQADGGGGYAQLPDVINALLGEGKIKIFKKGSVLSYGIVGAEEAERIRGLTYVADAEAVEEIERAGNKGIWTRDIKAHTNIPQVWHQIVTKTLRLLETRRLVKSVKSISSKNKKLFMLFDLGNALSVRLIVPSTEITGGPWYNEQEFDHVFIDTLSTFVYEVIKASVPALLGLASSPVFVLLTGLCPVLSVQGMSTLNAITDKVHASGISKVALGPEEIRSIIQTLMYDGRVEEVRSVRLTSAVRPAPLTLVSVVVLSLQVFDQCEEGNIISPRSCLYMTKWLDLKELDF
ncbi:hypothetical protein BBJ28_00004222 [Nothophytophthora sp. Chile5]|nr:hypothetical protein BBJ28_00004222 [Nothophytophthora sp. Chile5]